MIPQKRKYHAIIVHSGSSCTERALKALREGSRQPDTIVVVDHAQEPFVSSDPFPVVVRPAENRGYAAGINIGLGALYGRGIDRGDIVVGMNDDIVVDRAAWSALKEWWTKHPEPALVGVLVHEDGRVVYGGGKVNMLTGRALLNGKPGPLGYIHGAFFAAPFEVFITLKNMPTRGFMYWEDVILSYRARRSGYPLRVADNVHVYHEPPAGRLPSSDRLYYLVRNGARFMAEETSLPVRLLWRILNPLRWSLHSLCLSSRSTITQALSHAIRRYDGPRT